MKPSLFEKQPSRMRRPGITLLEVMISIGVVGVGLIGVAALIPLAHHKAAQGVREDRTALLGKRAFREFRVRGFDRPGFEPFGPARSPYWAFDSPVVPFGSPGYFLIYDPNDGRLVRRAYCLDPLMASATKAIQFPLPQQDPQLSIVKVPRLSLLSARPEDAKRTMTPQQLNQFWNAPLMTPAQAQEVFLLQDELVLDQPDDESLPPFQVYVNQQKRAAAGSFSWMATIVPDGSATSDRYTVSIAVFHRRQLTLAPLQEVVAAVDPSYLNGLTSAVKELRIVESPPELVDPPHAGVRHIKNGEWIMLMQQLVPGIPSTVVMKWYRVMSADELDEVPAGQIDADRLLALQGPDWPLNSPQPIYAVYVRNVVAVYEKTIRLHESSLYAY